MKVSHHDFVHPEDKAALEKLKAIPLFPACVKMFLKVFSEQFLYGMSMAQKIRLGPDQLPDIYRHLPPICDTLGIAVPEFYLENGMPNAYTSGDTRTSITVTAMLLMFMEEDEIQAVLAHECGHILCRHVLYHTMARMVLEFGTAIFGPLALAAEPVKLALLYWSRRSELSADRAAALVMKSPKPVVDTMMRLAGGPKSITQNVNIDLYIKQAEAYDKLQESTWDSFLQGCATLYHDHPFLAVRTREIVRWCDTKQFHNLLEAMERADAALNCPRCSKVVQENWKFCRFCGSRTATAPASSQQEESSHG